MKLVIFQIYPINNHQNLYFHIIYLIFQHLLHIFKNKFLHIFNQLLVMEVKNVLYLNIIILNLLIFHNHKTILDKKLQ